LQIAGTPGVRQQVLPATGQVMAITFGADTDLDIETEQTQATVGRQAGRCQMVFVDLRIMQANDAFRTPARHGRRRLLGRSLFGDQLVRYVQDTFRTFGAAQVKAVLAVNDHGRYAGDLVGLGLLLGVFNLAFDGERIVGA